MRGFRHIKWSKYRNKYTICNFKKGIRLMSENTSPLPAVKSNPLDGTEFNNKFIFRSNEFLNATQGILEGENPLSSKYRELTINEQRLFMLTLLKMTPNLIDVNNSNKPFNKPFEINIIPTNTMIKIFQGNKKYYETLREAASALYNLSVDLSDEIPGKKSKATGVKNFHKKRIFDEMKFGPDYGGLYFRFAEAVRPYLYDLYGKQYTKIAGRLVFALNSTYGIRLLELLLQYQNIKDFQQSGEIRRVFELEEFKRIFGLDKNKSYQQIGNIKNRVIKYAINDINKNTKYRIEYEDIKEGRSIKKFAFRMKISGNQNSEILDVTPTVELVLKDSTEKKYIDINDESSSLVEKLISYGIGPRVSRKLADTYDAELIKANVEYSLSQANIKNMAGYIRKAIENNYASSASSKQVCDNRKEEQFKKKLMELGLGNICSGVIIKTLEENKVFTSSEEKWLNESKIDIISLRDAYINNAPDQILVLPYSAHNEDTDESYLEDVPSQDEAIILRSELGMAIACKEKISYEKYQRAQELGIIPALKSMASLCKVDLIDLVKK